MQSSEQSLALMNSQCLCVELAVHLNFPEGSSGLEVARNLASSLWGEQRAIGHQTEKSSVGGGCGRDGNGKKEAEVATEALTSTRGAGLLHVSRGREETAASHKLKISLLHFLSNRVGWRPSGEASTKPRDQIRSQGLLW